MDHTTEMLLDMLIELLDNEPPTDAGQHPSMELQARFGAAWAEWDQKVAGLRLLLGVRLVHDAVEARKAAA